MKPAEIRQKSKKELRELLNELKEKIRNFRFALASGKVKNIREIRGFKKDIARILTILKEKEIKEREKEKEGVDKVDKKDK